MSNTFSDYNALGTAYPAFTLDVMANTDCNYRAACAALAVWDAYGVTSANRVFERGMADRSVLIGKRQHPESDDIEWIVEINSTTA